MWTIGQPLAVVPKSSPASLKPRPQVLLLVLRRNSSLVTLSGLSPGDLVLLDGRVARPPP